MQFEFPYQLVIFLDKEPKRNEPVYYGDAGWYPQVAIKRRFKLNCTTEEELIQKLTEFFNETDMPTISTGELVKPDRMPVRVIHIRNQVELKELHEKIISNFGAETVSRYPNREGVNYYPHITAEYNGEFVIPVDEYTDKSFATNNVWLLKDVDSENSVAYRKIR